MSVKREGILFGLCGPAGVGKSVLGARLLEKYSPELRRSVSVASRAPRSGEKDGEAYQFVSEKEFRRRIDAGEFFEWEKVHGNYYGTPRSALSGAIAEGRDLLLIIDIKGCLKIKQEFSEAAVIIFVASPSLAELKRRMQGRGALSPEELSARLDTAKIEYQLLMENAASIDYLLVNEQVEHTLINLCAIVDAERGKLKRLNSKSLAALCKT